jgi:uncharacterized membrane protein YcaP (DUF421 family)
VDLVLRAFVVFLFVLVITRAVGRRELSSLEPFDMILLIVIGDLVQQGITQSDYSVTGAMIVIVTIALLSASTQWLSFRFRPLRRALDGEPVVLVEDGRLIERNLRRERIAPEEVQAAGRQQQVMSVASMRWAVLETSGQISVIPKDS